MRTRKGGRGETAPPAVGSVQKTSGSAMPSLMEALPVDFQMPRLGGPQSPHDVSFQAARSIRSSRKVQYRCPPHEMP
jgi:hypothetical protein